MAKMTEVITGARSGSKHWESTGTSYILYLVIRVQIKTFQGICIICLGLKFFYKSNLYLKSSIGNSHVQNVFCRQFN